METINKTKRQPMEREKIFSHDVTNKGLISKNVQTAHTPQQQKTKQNNQAMDRRPK